MGVFSRRDHAQGEGAWVCSEGCDGFETRSVDFSLLQEAEGLSGPALLKKKNRVLWFPGMFLGGQRASTSKHKAE